MMEIYTTNEVLKILKTDKKTLLRLVHNGAIKAFRHGFQFRYTQKSLDDYIKQQTVKVKNS